MTSTAPLPPGQRLARGFYRFGLPTYAHRFPRHPDRVDFRIGGDVAHAVSIGQELQALPRAEQVSDFHCVTGWSCQHLQWSGYRFADFYREIVLPMAQPAAGAELVVFRGEDGYAASMPLADLLADGVILADQLDGQSLGIEHGAPLRLIAPAHYGYKNVKHIHSIEFRCDPKSFVFPWPWPNLMHHPRARVDLQERGLWIPARILKWIYIPIVPPTRWLFRVLQQRHQARLRDGH